MDNIIKS
jgi:hypothetical protein